MSYPSEGVEGYYRNPYSSVKKFLESRHAGHYKVYNLRSEKQYVLSRYESAANFPFDDHQAPPFSTLIDICNDASEWLKRDKNNVIAIHCKAGKGRTGTVIAAILLNLGVTDNAEKAMGMYVEARTKNKKGVTIPSQRRYVHYYDYMLKHSINLEESVIIQQIVMHEIPSSLCNSRDFSVNIVDMNNTLLYTILSKDVIRAPNEILINTTTAPPIQKDFKVSITNDKDKVILSFWLNAAFVSEMNNCIVHLSKQDIDLAFNDKSCKEFSVEFSIDLIFNKC
ncbi:unnamed protein product [Mucor hiemalis]